MRYKMTVKIETLDIPTTEDVPETFSCEFECENKDMGVAKIFEALSSSWEQLKREAGGFR